MHLRSQCRSCGAPIIWADTEHGNRMPLDADPVRPEGKNTFVLRGDVAVAVPPLIYMDEPHHVTHFATCPHADQHRRNAMSEFPLATVEGTESGEDPDLGKLFEVPRIAVNVDDSDPNVIKLAFSGSVELDRDNAQMVEFFNTLVAGESKGLVVDVHVAGATQRHRRDSEGVVDAVVQTKSLVVTDVWPVDAVVDD